MRKKPLSRLIPNSVRITRKATYEVLYTDEFFKDANQAGECRSDPKQILMNNNQSDTEKFSTFVHEWLHALSFETEDLNLTETQVGLLERAIVRSLKLNGVLDKL